jgi:hypothetical protein
VSELLEKELAAIGVPVSHREAAELARLKTAAEFERALVDGGWCVSRREAHAVLRSLRMRTARSERA